MNKIFNIIGFQAGWWSCVLGTKYEAKYFGPLIMLVFIIIHLYYFSDDPHEIKLVIFFAFAGTLVDTAMAYSGVLKYSGLYKPDILIAPLWITAMWFGFAATVNHSMEWLKNRWIAAFILGAVFGPLSYITAEKFGAVQFQENIIIVCTMLAIVWGASIPAIYWVNDRINNKANI